METRATKRNCEGIKQIEMKKKEVSFFEKYFVIKYSIF